MSVKFYAVLSLSLCIVLIPSLFTGTLLGQSFKKSSNFFCEAIKRRPNYCSPVSRSHKMFFTAQTMMPTGVVLLLLDTGPILWPLSSKAIQASSNFWANWPCLFVCFHITGWRWRRPRLGLWLLETVSYLPVSVCRMVLRIILLTR